MREGPHCTASSQAEKGKIEISMEDKRHMIPESFLNRQREKCHLKFQDNTLEISESCKYLVELIVKAMACHCPQKHWETSVRGRSEEDAWL